MIVARKRLPLDPSIPNSRRQVQRTRETKLTFLPLPPIHHIFILSICWFLLLVITPVGAVLVNITVDDLRPDPLTGRTVEYLPDIWAVGPCPSCTAKPDPGKMFDGTWHDTTYFPANSNGPPSAGPLNLTYTFNGTAVYIFCALALTLDTPTGFSNMSFYIDNEFVGQFERVPPGTQGYLYNVSVYANDSLPAGEHTFLLQNGQFGQLGNKSLVLFDYLVYSYDDGLPAGVSPFSSPSTFTATETATPSPSSDFAVPARSLTAGAIAGIVIGGIVGLAFVALLIWCLFIRRTRSNAHLRVVNKRYSVPSLFTNSQAMVTTPTPFTSTSYPKKPSTPARKHGDSKSKSRSKQQGGRNAGNVVLDNVDEEDARTLPPSYRYSLRTVR